MMEYRNPGRMEKWKNGVLKPIIPTFQYSNVSMVRYSNIPVFPGPWIKGMEREKNRG
jgi:hypothetical protein